MLQLMLVLVIEWKNLMSKLARKFLIGMASILFSVIALSLFINSNLIGRYYLYQEKKDLSRICNIIIDGKKNIADTIDYLEDTEEVVIVLADDTSDNDLLNERLQTAFLTKGLGLDKYWLWEQDRLDTVEKGEKVRLYYQKKLHYSILIKYVYLDGNIIAAAKIIPAVSRTISLINRVTVTIFAIAAITMLFILFILVKKITAPLAIIGETANSIAKLEFKRINIRTGDELEKLAEDMNDMSDKLKDAHQELESKNRQMELLLSNVSHDLKTPVALIKAYTSGIKDNMDDGTFLDTIICQNEKMEHMIDRLLNLAKVQQQEEITELVNISAILQEIAAEYQTRTEDDGVLIQCMIEDNIVLRTNKEAVATVLSNLISNGVKYTSQRFVELSLVREGEGCRFEIRNPVINSEEIDTQYLWEAFYVGEASRNKNMSGTGLGLSIVKAIATKYNFTCTCIAEKNMVVFTVTI